MKGEETQTTRAGIRQTQLIFAVNSDINHFTFMIVNILGFTTLKGGKFATNKF